MLLDIVQLLTGYFSNLWKLLSIIYTICVYYLAMNCAMYYIMVCKEKSCFEEDRLHSMHLLVALVEFATSSVQLYELLHLKLNIQFIFHRICKDGEIPEN